jgi:hypothetical protein
MGNRCLCDLLVTSAECGESLSQINRVPGCDGCHEQMQATGPVDLIFQCAITQFSQATKKELAGQGMKGLAFVQPDENATTQCLIAEVREQKDGPLQLA